MTSEAMTPPPAEKVADWLIWSNEHRCWWRPDRRGYTNSIEAAGRYTFAEALSQCDVRDRQKNGTPSEMPVPAPESYARLNAAAPSVQPGGWVLVPREPTEAMLVALAVSEHPADVNAGKKLQREKGLSVVPPNFECEEMVGKYQRMLAAAPAPSDAQSEREAVYRREFPGSSLEHQGETYKHIPAYVAWTIGQARASAGRAMVDAEAIAAEIHKAAPFCRDCADHDGTCPTDGLPCNRQARTAAIIAAHTHSAPPALTEEERSEVAWTEKFCNEAFNGAVGVSTVRKLLATITRLTS